MTRQKQEIIKHIERIETFIAADDEMGCGFTPAGFYDELYREIDKLNEQLAKLRHFANAEAMFMDSRGCVEELQWWK